MCVEAWIEGSRTLCRWDYGSLTCYLDFYGVMLKAMYYSLLSNN